MTYRELLKLYKQGKLSAEEAAHVEAELEKQDAISEYLCEEASIPQLEELFENQETAPLQGDSKKEQDFALMIHRSIRNAFLKLGAVVLALSLLILLFVQFALPHLVSLFYYNPGEQIAKNTNRMDLDLAVYTELTMPAQYRNSVRVSSNGYGSYDLTIYQNLSYNGKFTNIGGVLKRNQLTLYNSNVLQKPTGNIFGWYQADAAKPLTPQIEKDAADNTRVLMAASGTPDEALEKLKELNDHETYVAYVTLEELTPYQDFVTTFLKDESCPASPLWCAPRTNEEDKYFRPSNLGFRCSLSSSTQLHWDEETYPHLLLWQADIDEESPLDSYEQEQQALLTEDFAKTHFSSLLRYLSDQETFLKIMEEDGQNLYKDAAEYVEENPLMIYGFMTVADKEALLKLNAYPEVCMIATEELL